METQMTFTDDDLKWLKDEFNRGLISIERDGVRIDDILEALLARLEAAEAVCNYIRVVCTHDYICGCPPDDEGKISRYLAWRKAKGE